MTQISVSHLTFSYESNFDPIFEDVSFQIDTDWKLGFTGRNGRGKTTFLNLLLGKYEYAGSISASVSFDYFPYEVESGNSQTIDVLKQIQPDFALWKIQREFAILGLGDYLLYKPFRTLSKGEQTKILLAVLFLKENYFLLIDEPTNHLDQDGRRTVSKYLRTKKGFILVSHDRAFLDGCIDHILSINKENIEIQQGNFSSWYLNKQRQDAYELAENERLKKDVARLTAASRRTSRWSDKVEATRVGTHPADRGYIGHKSAKMMKRSKNIEGRRQAAVENKAKLLQNIENADTLKIVQQPYHANRLASLDDISVSYDGRIVCSGVSFTIERGDRIALSGKNGSGKSSIVKLILGESIPYAGRFQKGSNLIISYVSQDTSDLSGDLTSYATRHGLDVSIFKAMLRKLDFSRVQFEKDIRDFSGGQKKKVLIARSVSERSNLLLWDEPLNYVDIISRIQIEELLLAYSPTILFVEHDSAFCERIATKRVTL